MKSNFPMQRVVIVGAFGRLGQALSAHYEDRFQVTRLGRQELDLGNPETIRRALDPLEFDLLLLPAAQTIVDRCESEQKEAYALNAEAPLVIAKMCSAKGARMVHFSTDFVFDGAKRDSYTEEDDATPISVYGASKLAGEENVLEVSPDHLVIRLSWLYGSAKPAFPEWIVNQAHSEFSLSLPAEKVGCPTNSSDIVNLLDPLLFGAGTQAAKGIIHLCNSGVCSWQEWGQECLDLAAEAGKVLKVDRISANSLDDIPAFKARRPVNSAMNTAKYTRLTGITPRSWKEALRTHFLANGNSRQLCF